MVVPALENESSFDFLHAKAPWTPLVKKILGPHARLAHMGCIISAPGSETQKWHSDGDHVHSAIQLQPHCLNVFLPLVPLTPSVGPTEFTPETHLEWTARPGNVTLTSSAGDAILFDFRLRHRGLANKTQDTHRPLLYITYGSPFFTDTENFSSNRYRALPPLVKRRVRTDSD